MNTQIDKRGQRIGCLPILLVIVCIAVLTSVLTIWLAKVYLFPKEFELVQLDSNEQKVLNQKIAPLTPTPEVSDRSHDRPSGPSKKELILEPYQEKGADREIRLTERELNALIATNTDLARKLAIDLSDNLASAKLLLPLDPEFPFLGGKTLKVTAGLELRYAVNKPVVILRGISLWGVPLPNAWLGGIKNLDLVQEFGMQPVFWQKFAAGINGVHIEEGIISIKLKE